MLTPPAVRFVRCFDVLEFRMVNVWMLLSTQEQINNSPMATELTVQAKTVAEAMSEIRKWHSKWIDAETLMEIEKASQSLIAAQASIYEAKV